MRGRKLLFFLPLLLALLVSGCNFSPEAAKRRYLETGNKFFKNGKYKEASIMYRRAIQKDLKFGEAYYRLGLTELQLQRFQEAARALRRSIELDPKNADAHAKLADFLILAYGADRQRPQGALKEIQEIADGLLKADPKSYQGLRIRGLQLLLERKLKEAVEVLRAANQVQPLTRETSMPLAQALLADGQHAEAEELARAALQKDPSFAPLYDLMVVHYLRNNRPDAVEQLLKQKVAANPKQAEYRLQLAGHYYAQQRRPDMVRVLDEITANPTDFPQGHGQVGEFYFRIREFDQAIQQYQLGEKAAPKERLQYRVATAEVLAFNNKKTESAQLLDSVLKEDPNHDRALGLRASLRLQTGDPQQLQAAINDLQSVIRRSPQNAVLRFEAGRAQVAKGDVDQARVQFQEALRLRPDYVPPQLALAQLDLSKGEFAQALQGADKVLAMDPGNIAAKLIRSSALIGVGDKTRARSELEETLKVQPGSRDAQFQMAMLDFSDRQFRTAEDGFRRLSQMSPPDPRGLMGLVEVQVAQSEYDTATKMLESELQRTPDRSELRLYLANTCVRAGKYPAAVGHYQILLEKSPRRDDIYLRLGETYRRMGNLPAAIEATRKAQEIKPEEAMNNIQYALLLEASGRRQEARPMYERVLKVQPDNPIALNNLAFILADTGADLDQALTLAQRAKQKLPQDPNVSDTLGWIYIKKNLSDNAIQIFQELLRSHPGNPTYRYHFAMALFQKGDRPGAKRELEAALRSKPAKEDEIKIKDLMARIG